MQTVTLQIDDKVSDKFLWLLNHFSPSEVKVINNTPKTKPQSSNIESLAGSLSEYADPSKLELEEKAWELYVMDKYK